MTDATKKAADVEQHLMDDVAWGECSRETFDIAQELSMSLFQGRIAEARDHLVALSHCDMSERSMDALIELCDLF